MLLAAVAVTALGATATIGIAATRALTADGVTRAVARECAGATEYVQHTPAELEACITGAVRRDITRIGILPALVSLQRDANSNPALKALCHLALHELGREQQRAGLTVRELDDPLERDANWNSSCVGGFLHGYLQAVAERAPLSQVLDVGRAWCAGLHEQNRKGCAHAVGHGLARGNGNDLVRAASGCRMLPRTLHGDCLSGAVMELNFADRRLAGRMADDPGLGPSRNVSCSRLAREQRTWCRALIVKGELLVTGLTTIA